MIWILLLCHFSADYPLQTDAMVKAKKHFPGLLAHVIVHFMTMLVIIVGILHMQLEQVLPGILILTGCHFAIDSWKNYLSNRRPDWVIFTYLQDQVLHIVSILLVTFFIKSHPDILVPESLWVIPALSALIVSYVWFVTERLLSYRNASYQQWANEKSWSRMISRTLLLSAWFFGWNLWALLVLCFGLTFHWLDLSGRFHTRALFIDVSVVLSTVVGLSLL